MTTHNALIEEFRYEARKVGELTYALSECKRQIRELEAQLRSQGSDEPEIDVEALLVQLCQKVKAVQYHVSRRQKLFAIQELRSLTGIGLKDAKQAVERAMTLAGSDHHDH